MELLAEEIGLEGQENLCSFNFAQIKTLCSHFFRRCYQGVGIWANIIPEALGCADDIFERVFFLGLKR